MSNKNWKKSPWTIAIVSGLLPFFCSIVYDLIKEKPFFSTIWIVLKWIGNLLLSFINLELKLWWIVVGIALIIFIIYITDKIGRSKAFKPDFYEYCEDKFNKWKWTWEWKFSESKNVWIASNLEAKCPQCETPMIERRTYHHIHFDCPRCNFSASDNECDYPDKVERIIIDNIERKRKKKKQP